MGFFKKSRHAKRGKDDYVLPIDETEVAPLEYKVNPHRNDTHAPHVLTAEEVLGINSHAKNSPNSIKMQGAKPPVSPLDNLRKKVTTAQSTEGTSGQNATSVTVMPNIEAASTIVKKEKDDNNSLLEKCMPFITDGGYKPEEKPDYTLESVESIINLTEKKFSKLFTELEIDRSSVTYDALSKEKKAPVIQIEPENTKESPEPPQTIPMQRVEITQDTKALAISDIDNDIALTKTVSFEAVSNNNDFEDITSGTKILDLSEEMFEQPHKSNKIENLPELSASSDFEVPDDYKSPQDLKRVAAKLKLKRRNSFLKMFFNLLLTGVLSISLIPDLGVALLSTPMSFYITMAVIFLVMLIVNFDIFLSVKSLFTPRKQSSATVGVAALFVVLYSIISIINNVNFFDVIFCLAIILCFKAIASFIKSSAVLGNFRVIASKGDKYGIKLIDDKQTTFAMARNSIEGDVLAASSVKTSNIQDFLKNTYSDTALCGALLKLLVAVLTVSVAAGIVVAVRQTSLLAFFELCSFALMIFAAPTLLFADVLPFSRAAKRLNKLGAALVSVNGAKKLDMANAITLTSSQLFPDGTLSLHDMKVLDNNNIDATLIDAAAITNEIGSPLKGIFNSIAKTTPVDIPEADTIKYEERLGISGWINDRRIFIGNRTLLEAHGISTPPIEVDRKILRQGYFPVYLAVNGKPCALLVVKYNVKREIAVRLQRLVNIGVTFLVDSCDPNLTSEMICDYFGLYSESVRVMGGLGCQLNKNTTEFQENFSSPACHKGGLSGLLEIFCSAGKIKKGVNMGAGLHIALSLALLLFFVYNSLVGAVMPFDSMFVTVGNLISFAIYLIAYLFI